MAVFREQTRSDENPAQGQIGIGLMLKHRGGERFTRDQPGLNGCQTEDDVATGGFAHLIPRLRHDDCQLPRSLRIPVIERV